MLTMSDTEPVERARADRADVLRQITALDAELLRVQGLRTAQVQLRDRLTAFIDLYAKYTAPIPPPVEVAAADAPGTAPDSGEARKAPEIAPRATAGAKVKQKRRGAIQKKPKASPPMPDMIRHALLDAQVHGKAGLSPRQMQEFIAKQWWPSVKSGQISPIAWRMFDRGELQKDGDVYKLPADAAAPLEESALAKEMLM